MIRLSRPLLAAAAVLAAIAVAAPAAQGFPGRNGQLAYEGRASTSGQLVLRSASGGRVQRLAAPGRPADPQFSPLGRRIAFTSRTEIWVMFADGTSARQVTVGPEPSRDPAWSPDADALAFATGYTGDRDLYSIDADGYRLRPLTRGSADDEAPAWSTRGQIAFVRLAGRRNGDLWRVPATGGRARKLTTGGADDRSPAWSPDGRRMVFTRLPARRRGDGGRRVRELWVARADGRFQRRLARLRADVASPAWSPDGRRIAFAMGAKRSRGVYTLRTNGRGLRRVAGGSAGARSVDWQPRGRDHVIAGAGDIACDPNASRFATGLGTSSGCHMLQTSDLLMKMDLSAVLPLGDVQYEDGTFEKFQQSFHPTWGRLKSQMRPVVGNHEYRVPGAAGYFDYFNGVGAADGPAGPRDRGYYSYDLGDWHVVALNSQCAHRTGVNPLAGDCRAGSPQEQWLRADLAANPRRCTLAYWHHPLFSSGIPRPHETMQPMFQALVDNGVEVLLVGHDHGYERFAPMDAFANRDGARGVRQFLVGSGGKSLQAAQTTQPNSEIRENSTFGVLKLTLRPEDYAWEFVPEAGGTFRDAGANSCH